MAASKPSRGHDSIEPLIEAWRRERPDLDPWPLAILGRVQRLSHHLLRSADGWLNPLGLSWESFSVIVTLRRSGAPFELKPTDLYRESLLSSGAITHRIDRVERMGLVTRRIDPKDRRSVIVRLTPKGRALADRAIGMHFAAMADVLSVLTPTERKRTAGLLQLLLLSMEQTAADQASGKRRARARGMRPEAAPGRLRRSA